MALYISEKANVQVFTNSTKTDCLFGPGDKAAELLIAGMQKHSSGTFDLIATDVTPQAITLPLGDLTDARGLYLKVSTECQVDLNGVGNLTVSPGVDALGAPLGVAKLVMDLKISSVVVTLPAVVGGQALTGSFCIWGDPVAP